MKRRSFLAGGAAAAASPAIGRVARSQSTHRPAFHSWSLLGPSNRYVIRLTGPAVIGDVYGRSDDSVGDDAPRGAEPFERAAMILQGPERRPVSWRVAVWHQSSPLALRIALSGVEVPLEAEL